MIVDTGLLISVERGEQAARQFIEAAKRSGKTLHTSHAVVAQAWRGGNRQVQLAKFIKSLKHHPLDDGRAIGGLLGNSGTSDVVDAHLVLLAIQLGEDIITGDPDDLRILSSAFGSGAPTIHSWP